MSRRRMLALLVLAFDAYLVLRVSPGMGMLGPVFQLIGAFVGVGALAVLAFDLPMSRPGPARRPGSTGGVDGTVWHRVAGAVGILLLVVAPMAIALRGAYLGVLPSFVRPRGPDISFAHAPALFALNLLAYVGWAAVFIGLMLRQQAANQRSARDAKPEERPSRKRDGL